MRPTSEATRIPRPMSSPFPPVGRSDTLAQQAYLAIRVAIQSESLTAGTFYSENEVGQLMGISRTPVREALIELAREGLVEIFPQRGFQLRVLTPDEASEVFELRKVLESHVVRRLAVDATAEQFEQLREVLHRQRECLEDQMEFLRLDEEFHLIMPEFIGHWRTHQILSTLRGAMWLIGGKALTASSRSPIVVREHAAILEAMEARDPDAAVAAIELHMDSTEAAAARIAGPADS